MNQPELEAITCTMLAEAREHALASRDLVWFYFSFAEKVARVLSNTLFFFIRMLFFRPRLNILIFLPILG